MGGLLFWYSEEGIGWAAARRDTAVSNVTAHPSMASVLYRYKMVRCCAVLMWRLKG